MMKTRLGAPFSARRAPLILAQMHSFFRVSFWMWETCKSRRYSIEKPKNLPQRKAQKFLRAFGALTLHYVSGAHSANCPPPPSTSGWIHPWSKANLDKIVCFVESLIFKTKKIREMLPRSLYGNRECHIPFWSMIYLAFKFKINAIVSFINEF